MNPVRLVLQTVFQPRLRIRSIGSSGWLVESFTALTILLLIGFSSHISSSLIYGNRPSFFGIGIGMAGSFALGLIGLGFLISIAHTMMGFAGRSGSVLVFLFASVVSFSPFVLEGIGSSLIVCLLQPYFGISIVEMARIVWFLLLIVDSLALLVYSLNVVYGKMSSAQALTVPCSVAFVLILIITLTPLGLVLKIMGGLA
ncbi:MAG: hypothetical protein H3C47_08530 [Candidatus Cloacimonetes bacterium]|nr:hypothetical protein [Candidatus Cloacimonadota bacterium]